MTARRDDTVSHPPYPPRPARVAPLALFAALAIALLAGCGGQGQDYGGANNHMHDLLALAGAPGAMLTATHLGLYRTADDGKTWDAVGGEPGQVMDGLMIYKLAQSPVDGRYIYVLAVPRPDDKAAAKDKPGIYASADAGKTWKLATAVSSLPSPTLYTIAAGAGGAGQIYALLPALGDHALYTSDDAGAHWRPLGAIPSGATGIVPDPEHAGHLLLYSPSAGLFESRDNGQTWNAHREISGGVIAATFIGTTVYAIADSGVYASRDSAGAFTSINREYTFSSLAASPSDANHVYARTGTDVYTSTDGGKSWKRAAGTPRHPEYLSADPANTAALYVGMSYPVGVQATGDGGAHWRPLLP